MKTKKQILQSLKKVGIAVWGENGLRFADGSKSKSKKVYEETPDKVLKIINDALDSYCEKN